MHVFLRTSIPENVFRSCLQDLHITVAGRITGATPPNPNNNDPNGANAPAELVLDHKVLNSGEDPKIIHVQEPDTGSGLTYALWTVRLHLDRPGQQLQKPAVHFTASASFNTIGTDVDVEVEDEYMESAVPTPENLFQSLHIGGRPSNEEVRLPASRIQKVAPRAIAAQSETKPLRCSTKLYPIVPAFMLRVHYSSAPSCLIASLDVEVSSYVGRMVELQKVGASSAGLTAVSLNGESGSVSWPQSIEAGDRSTFLYRLSPTDAHGTDKVGVAPPKSIIFELKAVAAVTEECSANLLIRWHGGVPLSAHGFPSHRTHYWQRQAAVGYPPPNDSARPRPMSNRYSQTGRASNIYTPDAGVTFAVTGPETVTIGETFILDVFVVNRGVRRRRMAVFAVTQGAKTTSTLGEAGRTAMAEVILDDQQVYAAQNTAGKKHAHVIHLNADVRIG